MRFFSEKQRFSNGGKTGKGYYRFFVIFLALNCWLPHIASAQVVNIPDANLEAALRELFEANDVLGPNEPITKQHMELILSVNLW